jgi:hypothetical protein
MSSPVFLGYENYLNRAIPRAVELRQPGCVVQTRQIQVSCGNFPEAGKYNALPLSDRGASGDRETRQRQLSVHAVLPLVANSRHGPFSSGADVPRA